MSEKHIYKNYVDEVFGYFDGCLSGQGLFFFRTLNAKNGLDQSRIKMLAFVAYNLIDQEYLYSDDGHFVKLTDKGYAYTQDRKMENVCIDLKTMLNFYDYKNPQFQTLWMVIGKEGEAPFYVSGPAFFNVVKNYVNVGAVTYTDYMNLLADNGESQSRSIWYRKLFSEIHKADIDRFLDDLSKVIYDLYNMAVKVSSKVSPKADHDLFADHDVPVASSCKAVSTTPEPVTSMTQKTVFISYCHDGEAFDGWVGKLASDIRSAGIRVITDQDMAYGTEMNLFMEKSVADSNRVLIVCTKKYKERADDRSGGVGYESCIITGELVNDQNTIKFVPIIKEGSGNQYYPRYLGNRWGADMKDPKTYSKVLEKLINDILTH